MNSQQTPFALFIGILVGLAIWLAMHKGGFGVTVVLLTSAVLSGTVYSKNLKDVQAGINRRGTGC